MPTRALRVVIVAVLAAALLVACGVRVPTATPIPPTATATPTPWPTKTPTATATPAPPPTPTPIVTPSPLDGVWQLVRIEYMSGKVVTIEKPESYTVQFLREGRVQVKADCNSGMGAYQMSSERVTIEGVSTTKMACASGSMGDLFVSTLANAASYRVERDELTVTLKYDGGDMVFVKAR